VAMGDGANDIPMLQAAGFGVAYHAKPKTQAATSISVRFGGLDTVRKWFR
jgi:phosphoserine phosphatase